QPPPRADWAHRPDRGRLAFSAVRKAGGVSAVMAVVVALLALSACGVDTEHHSVNAALVSGKPGFAPSRVTVKQRDKVVLRVGNRTTSKHGFSIRGYAVTE